jgi:glycosyltransferase involved in cell wall biosynthesis
MKINRKKVLIISYLWPPIEGVGVLRALKFAKYLPEYGWQPIILTTRPERTCRQQAGGLSGGMKVYRTEYRDIIEDIKGIFRSSRPAPKDRGGADGRPAKKASVLRELVSMPDEQIGWRRFAVTEGRKIIEADGIDMIFSTSPPETAHLVARQLKRRYRIPWVADMRDLWADDHFRPRPLFKKAILSIMEKKVLEDADAVVTVSEPWAEKLKVTLRNMRDKVRVIENGYDEEDFNPSPFVKNDKFTISYTGKLHREHQPVEFFLKALKDLIKEGRMDRNKLAVKFYILGYDRPDITALAGAYGLGDVVKEFEKVGYDKSLEIQRSSDALLFVQWRGAGGDGWYSAKIYDYLGARRPILALAARGGIIDKLITETSSGYVACDEGGLKDAVLKLYNDYIKNDSVKLYCNEDEVSRHTRRLKAAELAGIFDSLTKKA